MRLIDADKIYPDVRTQRGALAISQGQLAYAKTVNALLIPEDATNGDVIKAMFPNASIHYHKADELVDDYVSVNIIGCDIQQDYSAEWWDAPYKVEREGK